MTVHHGRAASTPTAIGVVLPDGPSVHVAFLAAEKAGCPSCGSGRARGARRSRRAARRLREAGAVALVTFDEHDEDDAAGFHASVAADVPALRSHVVVDGAAIDEWRLGPDDLFMFNSTSATTGLPKCVLHTQNRWMYFHQEAVEHGALSADDGFLSAIPAPYGFGLWTAHFTPTLLGVPTVSLERFSPHALLSTLEQHAVTVLCCVSTPFVMLLDAPDLDRTDVPARRVVLPGGEAVPRARAEEFEARTGATVLRFFGSNETGLLSGTRLDDAAGPRLTTAGRVVEDMRVRLYDGDVDVTARGVGQPAARGTATALGYLGGDEVNAPLFTADGWMLMGDLCTLEDGYLRGGGRKSDFIVRGGTHVSAVEVERLVGERVCAFVELVDGASLALDDLAAFLRAAGASREMTPERLAVVDELPRSSGGKIAKGRLVEHVAASADGGR